MNLTRLWLAIGLVGCFVVTSWGQVRTVPVRAPEILPPDAQETLDGFEKQVAIMRQKAEEEILAVQKRTDAEVQAIQEKCRAALQALQDMYTKAGKLDEAVAIRDRLRTFAIPSEVLKDPGSLYGFNSKVGQVFYFETEGKTVGSLWGANPYTADSSLAKAVVHSGVLKAGQKGIVKVTILPGQNEYKSTSQNGITSSSWGTYSTSYKVEPAVGVQKK